MERDDGEVCCKQPPLGCRPYPPPAPDVVGVQSEEGLDVKEVLSGCWEATVLS